MTRAGRARLREIVVAVASITAAGACSAQALPPRPAFSGENLVPGDVQRITRPFTNWTLVCDEIISARRRVCNLVEAVLDRSGTTIFSWSLSAGKGGRADAVLQLPALAPQTAVALEFGALGRKPAERPMCADRGCTTTVAFDKAMEDFLVEGGTVIVHFIGANGQEYAVPATGVGLAQALAAAGGGTKPAGAGQRSRALNVTAATGSDGPPDLRR